MPNREWPVRINPEMQTPTLPLAYARFNKGGCVCSGGHGVDRWAVTWLWNLFLSRPAGFQPGLLGDLHFAQCLLGRFTEAGARLQIRNIRDVPAILLTVKQIYVIIAHTVNVKWNSSTSRRNCR